MRTAEIYKSGFLTKLAAKPAHRVPYKRFSKPEIKTFEKFFRYVWWASAKFEKHHEVDFYDADERHISYALGSVIDLLISNTPEQFDWFLDVFEYEGQGADRANWSRTSVQQQCDFALRRTAVVEGELRTLSCLFIEAKIISNKSNVSNYAESGMMRFVEGSYAHAMPQAVMMGYQRATNQKLPDPLVEHFKRDGRRRGFELEVTDGPNPVGRQLRGTNALHSTVHERRVPNAGGVGPGPIELYHLWLHVDHDRS